VDIGLSVSGETTFAPVMVIEDAGRKPLPVLSEEIVRRTPEVRAKDAVDLARTRRWGWLVPFGFLRRALLRALFNRTWFRRRLTGTFQVTCVSPADWSVPITFNTCACLAVGRVRDRVVAVDGRPAVRPMVTLVVTVDHNAWDGARALVFFEEMRRVLESDALDAEVGDAADAGPGLSPREPRGR
jgi:pyruvate/2-oxoglutarate dehydrogenase complex dihydrolipoamide acyltransferase (E2) component